MSEENMNVGENAENTENASNENAEAPADNSAES